MGTGETGWFSYSSVCFGSISAGRLPWSVLLRTVACFANYDWSVDLDSDMLLPFHGWNA